MRALVRRPPSTVAAGERTFVAARPVDAERVRAEHAGYVAELRALGVEVEELPPLDDQPDSAFVEDAAVVLDELAIVTRPGAPSRRGEVESVAEALAPWRELVRLDEPCTLDGGDALLLGRTLLVGQSTRTNHPALKRLAHLLLEHGYRVKAVEVAGCLHLKSAATLVAPDLLLASPARIHAARIPEVETIEVDPREPAAANALAVAGAVLVPSSYPRTADRLAARGLDVRPVDLAQTLACEAGPTCLSIVFDP